MSLEDENKEYLDRLEEQAKSLVGTWVCEKHDDSYHFVYDYYVSDSMVDVILLCYYIPNLDRHCAISESEVYMSEFKDYYRKGSKSKGEKLWKNNRGLLDNLFLGKKGE